MSPLLVDGMLAVFFPCLLSASALPLPEQPALNSSTPRIAGGVQDSVGQTKRAQSAIPELQLEHLLNFLDRDGDGSVDAYEGAEAWLHLTSEADSDGNRALTAAELGEFLGEHAAEEREEREEFFHGHDANGDGILQLSEVPGDLRDMIAGADSDGNGKITTQELHQADDLGNPAIMFRQELSEFFADRDDDNDGFVALADLPPDELQEFARLDKNDDKQLTLEEVLVLIDEELGGATFEVEGSVATMTGVIGPSTPGRVLQLVLEHPEVTTISMLEVPGSMDDDSNLRAARLVRHMGFDTHLPADGEVASGGTDFFLAGVERRAEAGARFGVHSWSGMGEEGADVPRDDPEHQRYISFYDEVDISEDFYWYTLEAAPADGIHWMSLDELELYDMLTVYDESDDSENEDEERENSSEREEPDLLGGCVQRTATGVVPDDIRKVRAVNSGKTYAPLMKSLNAHGIILAAEAEVPDVFLERVGKTIAEIFDPKSCADPMAQEQVIEHLYRYQALLPVPRNERSFEHLHRTSEKAVDQLIRTYSICDIIMSDVPNGQVMEVIEHILHTVTDVGLHYQYPSEWGLSRESDLYAAMLLAVDKGYYEISSYKDMEHGAGAEIYERVLMQEFAYWFITTAWDLQRPYGPNEREWTIRTPADLKAKMPQFFAVFERTASRVMRAPSLETLAEIGPTRKEEG